MALVLAAPAMAYQGLPDPGVDTVDGLIGVIYQVFDVLFAMLIIAAIAMIIYAAFTYVTAAGDSGKVGTANQMIIYAAAGIVVAIFAKAVPTVVANILGVDAGI